MICLGGLAISDLVVEDLELDGKKKPRLIQELEVKLEEKSTYMLAIIIVAISVLGFLAFLLLPPSQNNCLSFVKIWMYLHTKTCLDKFVDSYFETRLDKNMSKLLCRDWPRSPSRSSEEVEVRNDRRKFH